MNGHDDPSRIAPDPLVSPQGLVSLASLASGPLRPPPALIEGFLLDRTITQVSAAPYTGKSLLLQAIMLSLDSGLPLFNRFPVPRRKSTLFLGFDARPWDYVQQSAKLVRGMGADWPRLNSHFKFRDRGRGPAHRWKLTSPGAIEHLKALHSELGFGVLMLDTFRRFHTLNQNDDRDMASFMEQLIALSDDLGIAIIFTNHTRKPSEATRGSDPNYDARGSTEIPAAVDFNLVLQRRPQSVIRLHLPKGRGASEDALDSLDFRITYGGPPDAPSVALVPLDQGPAGPSIEAVARSLISPFKRSQLIAALAAAGTVRPERAADSGIAWLQRNGRIVSTGRGSWRLVPH